MTMNRGRLWIDHYTENVLRQWDELLTEEERNEMDTPASRLQLIVNSDFRSFGEVYVPHPGSDTEQQDRQRAYRNDLRELLEQRDELLDALRWMMADGTPSQLCGGHGGSSCSCVCARKKAEAAISKATKGA